MKKRIASLLVFLASSQAWMTFGEEVFTPIKPIHGHSLVQQLSAIVERVFAWL
ncbi:MAG TPA: hypothetical protein VH815_03680 [Acidobacteriota bacterium]